MKDCICVIFTSILLLSSCSSKKKLEATSPFRLGEVYAQEWVIDEAPEITGYEVVVPIVSLSEDEAVLKNLYHKGKMQPLEIKLTELGNVAIAEFGADLSKNENPGGGISIEEQAFPFELTETQAVISYVQNKKVRYYKINGIRQNLPVSYPTELDKARQ